MYVCNKYTWDRINTIWLILANEFEMHLNLCCFSLPVAERASVFILRLKVISVFVASERVTHIFMVPTSSEIITDVFSRVTLISIKNNHFLIFHVTFFCERT